MNSNIKSLITALALLICPLLSNATCNTVSNTTLLASQTGNQCGVSYTANEAIDMVCHVAPYYNYKHRLINTDGVTQEWNCTSGDSVYIDSNGVLTTSSITPCSGTIDSTGHCSMPNTLTQSSITLLTNILDTSADIGLILSIIGNVAAFSFGFMSGQQR